MKLGMSWARRWGHAEFMWQYLWSFSPEWASMEESGLTWSEKATDLVWMNL